MHESAGRNRCRSNRQRCVSRSFGQQGVNGGAKFILYLFEGLASVDHSEAELFRHPVELFNQQSLVLFEAVLEIPSESKVHPGFPIVHPLALDLSQRRCFDIDAEITNQVRSCRWVLFPEPSMPSTMISLPG